MTGVIAECPVIPPLDPAHFVDIAMFGQAVKADPVAVLSARASQPPFYVMLHGRPHVVICRYDQLLAAFTDHDTFSRVPQPGWGADTFDYFNGLPTVGDSDPPEHSRLRRLMWPAFTPRRMSQVQARLDRLVDGMIDDVAGLPQFDLVMQFSRPLVRRLLLGIVFELPEADWHIFADFSEVLGLNGTVPPGAPKPAAYLDRCNAGHAYCAALIEQRRREPKPDLVGDIVSAHDAATPIRWSCCAPSRT